MIRPTKDEFLELSRKGNLIPLYCEVIADMETPISAFRKLEAADYSFLLESAESGDAFGRYSFVGSEPSTVFSYRDREVEITHYPTAGSEPEHRHYTAEGDPLDELKELMSSYEPVEVPGLALFSGGAVGFLSFESVRYFEPSVPMAKTDDLHTPDAVFILTRSMLIFDHLAKKIQLVVNAHVQGDPEATYDQAVEDLEKLQEKLEGMMDSPGLAPVETDLELQAEANMTKEEYVAMTSRMQEYIRAGDIFQVVPSQRFAVPFDQDPIQLYRVLRYINPSPYMFCLKFGDLALVGSSPETHVKCDHGKVELHPIAGTRPRRENPEEDLEMEKDLLADPKERAEHVMLVDLGRNDLGRVCEYESVEVTDFMQIERYSHVMHIVSHVTGSLKPEFSSYDVLRATFPAGTVTGAPKVRAMQIIAEGEPTRRGVYSGAVGYFGFSGNLDCCIAIRTVVLSGGYAYVQAGGGLVADSTPEGEYQESINKAKAAVKALALSRELD